MSKSVYNQLIDEVGGQKVPHSLNACKTDARLTESNLNDFNWRITQNELLTYHKQLKEDVGGT